MDDVDNSGATQGIRSGIWWLGSTIGLAALSYATYVAVTWYRYGRVSSNDGDLLLDQFMPTYEVVERHGLRVAASAENTFSAACNMHLQQSALIGAIFKVRELILGGKMEEITHSPGLAAQAKEWGWGILAEVPGREIIFGAATQPWLANPRFLALSANEFKTFEAPGFVKIAWTLRADPIDHTKSLFRTETRASTTDAASRAKFRRYWAFFSPGISLIRWISLGPLKAQAQSHARAAMH